MKGIHRICTVFLAVLMIAILSPKNIMASPFSGGSGTPEDPYQIATPEQLNAIRDDLSASYVLTEDIDLSAYASWVPIGSSEDNAFEGNFDGDGHCIRNLTLTNQSIKKVTERSGDSVAYIGLFGYVKDSVVYSGIGEIYEIKNLEFKNVQVDINEPNISIICGSVAGKYYGNLKNCQAEGSIHINNLKQSCIIGGLIGTGNTVNDSISQMDIRCAYGDNVTCGGVIGYANQYSDQENRYSRHNENDGDIIIEGFSEFNIGGIAGFFGNYLENCINYGNMSGTSKNSDSDAYLNVGGIAAVGNSVGTLKMTHCVNYGHIKNEDNGSAGQVTSGGILGSRGYGCLIDSCVNRGNIETVLSRASLNGSAGGIFGFHNNQYIQSGELDKNTSIINCQDHANNISVYRKTDAGKVFEEDSAFRICAQDGATLSGNTAWEKTEVNEKALDVDQLEIGQDKKHGETVTDDEYQSINFDIFAEIGVAGAIVFIVLGIILSKRKNK